MKGTRVGRLAAQAHPDAARRVWQSRGVSASCETHQLVKVGEVFGQSGCFSTADVEAYTHLTGDTNPIHTILSAAREAGFAACVVPGMLCGSLFPAIIGSRFAGALYVSQDLKFRRPLLVNEAFLSEVEVCSIVKLRQHAKVTFFTRCFRKMVDTKPIVLDGQAVALIPMLFVNE